MGKAERFPRTETIHWGRRKIMGKYVCSICGYVYDPEAGDPDAGVAAGVPFEKLPDEWVCPICGAAKEDFSPE
jgi:rubredoxin